MASWKDNTIMLWDGEKVSDHGREPLAFDTERIEQKERMIDGTMRRNLITTKRTIQTSWNDIPSKNFATYGPVDGGMCGEDMKAFVDQADDPISVTLRDGAGNVENILMYIDDFSWDINKRGVNIDLWNASVSLVEV